MLYHTLTDKDGIFLPEMILNFFPKQYQKRKKLNTLIQIEIQLNRTHFFLEHIYKKNPVCRFFLDFLQNLEYVLGVLSLYELKEKYSVSFVDVLLYLKKLIMHTLTILRKSICKFLRCRFITKNNIIMSIYTWESKMQEIYRHSTMLVLKSLILYRCIIIFQNVYVTIFMSLHCQLETFSELTV